MNEAPVAVPSPSRIARFFGQNFNHVVVKTEIQNGVHHAWHRSPCTGTDGYEKWVFFISEFHAGFFFQHFDVFKDFRFDFVVDLFAVLIVLSASFGGDGEAERNRQTDMSHFGKVSAFAAEQVAHILVAFGKFVNKLLCHRI